MSQILTYLDSGVLFLGRRSTPLTNAKVESVLRNSQRAFIGSDFLALEVLPKAIYHKQQAEEQFYRNYFNRTVNWVRISQRIYDDALQLANTFGLAAMDAFHLAAALQAGAAEFITTEKPTKPLFRATALRVIHLMDL